MHLLTYLLMHLVECLQLNAVSMLESDLVSGWLVVVHTHLDYFPLSLSLSRSDARFGLWSTDLFRSSLASKWLLSTIETDYVRYSLVVVQPQSISL